LTDSPNFDDSGIASMARKSYAPKVQTRTKRLLETLLAYANNELENCDHLKIQSHSKTWKELLV